MSAMPKLRLTPQEYLRRRGARHARKPVVIIEILSPSTERYDRGAKFDHYQYIKTLAEYVLVSQDTRRVERYVRQPNGDWGYRAFKENDDVIRLEGIGCELVLREIYLKVPEPAKI